MQKRFCIDIEANNLLPDVDKIHCISIADMDSSYSELFVGEMGIKAFALKVKQFPDAQWIGHNIYAYDAVVLSKVAGINLGTNIRDTFLEAQICFPDVDYEDYRGTHGGKGKVFTAKEKGSHSLRAWGQRLGCYKGEYNGGFESYNDDMGAYCIQDTQVCKALAHFLEAKLPEKLCEGSITLELENEIAPILARQQAHGVLFDVEKAEELYNTLQANLIDLKWKLLEIFKPRYIDAGEFTPKRNDSSKGYKAGATFHKIELEEYNPNSRTQTIDRLIKEFNWNPQEFTDKGNVKFDETIVDNLPFPELKPLKEYLQTNSLISKIKTAKGSYINYVKSDGRIHGGIMQNGAITGRMSHYSPNLSNTTSEKKLYGKEVRSLFRVPEGKIMMGFDADALEARILAGYCNKLDNGKMIEIVTKGTKETKTDLHTVNMLAYNITSRELAKTVFYACVPMDTTALTKEGWKCYEELQVGELVLTYNSNTNTKEWKPILEKVYYKNAPIVEMRQSKFFSFRSTPNHRWFVRQRQQVISKNNVNYWLSSKGRYMQNKVLTTETINTESSIITNAPYKKDVESTYKFDHDADKYRKSLVNDVLNMSSSERQAFLHGFLLADGHKRAVEFTSAWSWSQNVNEISEALLIASYIETDKYIYVARKEGHNGKEMITVSIGRKSHITGQKLQKIEHPEQPVWCIRTENESFVARQGNCITITGNTVYGALNAKIGLTLLEGGIDFHKYVGSDFDEKVDEMIAWIDGKNEEDRANGKTVTERSRKYWECWVAGKHALTLFGEQMPALPKLKENIHNIIEKYGYIKAIDGRKLYSRSKHGELNTLCQSAGAIIMKKVLAIADKNLHNSGLRHGVDYEFIINSHDELQLEVTDEESIKDRVRTGVLNAFEEAGRFFKFPCPIIGSAKEGKTWADTH